MKSFKVLLGILVLGVLVTLLPGCGTKTNGTTGTTQTSTVTKGNLTQQISAAGNLALSTVKDLTFDLFYQTGTVATVNVAVGDTVTKGQVLASLDSSEWNDKIQTLQDALTAANRDVSTKQRALATAQRNVITKQSAVSAAQRNVTTCVMAVTQAQLNIISANNTLNKIQDVKVILDKIDTDNFVIKYGAMQIESLYQVGGDLYTYWGNRILDAKTELVQDQADLAALLAGASTTTKADIALQIAQDVLAVQKAQFALQVAQSAVDDANTAVTNAQQDLDFAQQDINNAQSDLDISNQKAATAHQSLNKAKASNPDITATIDGFVTKVNVAGGDEVLSGTIAIQIVDPNKFEADILVSEMNIPQVKLGGTATVIASALPTTVFTAQVTKIAPTATITSGVVNYNVKVEVQSAVSSLMSQFGQSGNGTRQLPSSNSGNLTSRPNSGTGATGIPGFPGASGNQSASRTTSATTVQLKQGFTVTVNIIIATRTNVLLVPKSAVITDKTGKYVNIVSSTGDLVKTTVTTGLSDWQNIEIISGLSEGDKVNIPKGTGVSTSTSSGSFNVGGILGGR
jgi:multidrug efflux pump subunit AcrA (membrane-fusion protein)